MAKAKKVTLMDKAKQKQKELEQRRKGGGKDFPFQYLSFPESGKMTVRVYPPWSGDEDGDFFIERQEHRISKGDKFSVVACPAAAGEGKCPCTKLVETGMKKVKALKDKGDKAGADKAYKTLVDPYKAKSRYYVNANRLSEDGPVQTGGQNAGQPAVKPEVFAFGQTVFQGLLQLITEDEAEICGIPWEKGNAYDFFIKKTGTGFDTKYAVQPSRKLVKADTTEAAAELHDLTEAFSVYKSFDEIQALFDGVEFVKPDDEDEPKAKSGKKASKADDEEDEEVSEDEEESEEDDSEDEESEEEEEADEDDEESEDEEADDDEDEESAEDDDEEEAPKKGKGKAKSKADDEEDEDEEVSEEDEDEESDEEASEDDEEEAPKSKAKPKGKAKPADDEEESEEEEEDGDEDDEESDDEASEDEESEDDEEEEKPKGKKASPKGVASKLANMKRKK